MGRDTVQTLLWFMLWLWLWLLFCLSYLLRLVYLANAFKSRKRERPRWLLVWRHHYREKCGLGIFLRSKRFIYARRGGLFARRICWLRCIVERWVLAGVRCDFWLG